jgi:hypothetical protein
MALRAWDLRAARGQLDLPHALLWLGIGAVVGGLPLLVMLPTVGIMALLAGMLVTPVVGLYALLIAIPFSPSLGVEDAGFSISVFEPLAATCSLSGWRAGSLAGRSSFPTRASSAHSSF